MKLLLAMNERFLSLEPERIFELIQKYDNSDSKAISGIELKIDTINDSTLYKVRKIASLIKAYNMELCFRGIDIERSSAWHDNFLRLYNNVSSILGKRVLVVYSSYLADSKINCYIKTKEKLKEILNIISENKYNLDVSIENLEYTSRLETMDISRLLNEEKEVYFTYDVGHEVVRNKCSYVVPKNLEERIRNVNVHDTNDKTAHYPFIYGNIDLYATFTYLNSIGYSKFVTLEIYPNFLEGSTTEEILISYITEAKKVSFIMNRC